MEQELLKIESSGARISAQICRPHKGNSLSVELLSELDTFTRQLCDGAFPDAKTVILSGAGDRAFSAGADIASLAGLSASEATNHMLWGQQIFQRLEDAPQVTIAAIAGVAYGGGLELAMAADLRTATPQSRLGQPEITLANIPGWAGTQRLPCLIGQGRALQMILSGEPISAELALEWGLLNVVADDALAAAHSLADIIESRSATALHLAKDAVYAGQRLGTVHGSLVEARHVGTCCTTPEQRAAVQGFLDRKKSKA
ncbi:MAG: enoyl-CoA hydratase/isomerase family protein [Beutenbergiaceae bacterium]